jgi:Xaa-Pro aminopeptidase
MQGAYQAGVVPTEQPAGRELTSAIDYHARRQRLLACSRLESPKPDAVLVADATDIHYLTGVAEGISWLAVWDHGCFLLGRHMLIEEAREEAPDCEVLLASERSTDKVDVLAFLIAELVRRKLSSAAVDLGKIDAQTFLKFAEQASTADLQLIHSTDLLDPLRQCKDSVEYQLIRQCSSIAEQALIGLLAGGAGAVIGRQEKDISRELESRMLDLGADRQGFPGTGIIVASGPNSASAHHSPGARKVAAGEPLLIDWGAELHSYRSDFTRTVFPVTVPDFAKKAYPVVEAALEAAVAKLKVGAPMGDADLAARQTVMEAGYPEFHYGVGHGVGLDIHESPWIRANSEEPFLDGMITTIEPGIYLRGTGGIRIENLYRITPDGVERIGELPTALESMILE